MFRNRRKCHLLVPVLLLLAAGQAGSEESMDLYISTGAITHVAVGEKLELRAYMPRFLLDSKQSGTAVSTPLTWRVRPAGVASVSREGVLTALLPGRVTIDVEMTEVPEAQGPTALPGSRQLTILEKLPGGRLPRVDGAHRLEYFSVHWYGPDEKERRGLGLSLGNFAWRAGITTEVKPDTPLPWTLDAVPGRSWFDDDPSPSDTPMTGDWERMKKSLTAARLTITSWKDGVASGRVLMKTSRGVEIDAAFTSWVEDTAGVLAKAASPPVVK